MAGQGREGGKKFCESISREGVWLKSITQEGRQGGFWGAGLKVGKNQIYKEEKRMAQGMENTVSNGQGSKPHSAIEKGEVEISSEWSNEHILNSSMLASIYWEIYLADVRGEKVDKLFDCDQILFVA